MTTEFFYKRICKIATLCITVSFLCFSFAYAAFLSSATVVDTAKTFYFLVSPSTHLEVSAHNAAQIGGAGYLLHANGRDYAALSVYLTDTAAAAVSTNLTDTPTQIIPLESNKLYLKTRRQKQQETIYKNAFSCLVDCIRVLDIEISRVERGATQQSSKRILKTLENAFAFLSKEYKNGFAAFATVCKNAANRLSVFTQSTVYIEDLRYLQCELCVSYLRLSEDFRV